MAVPKTKQTRSFWYGSMCETEHRETL